MDAIGNKFKSFLLALFLLVQAVSLPGFGAYKKPERYLPMTLVSGLDSKLNLFINAKSLNLDLFKTNSIRIRVKTATLFNSVDTLASFKINLYEMDDSGARKFITTQALSMYRGASGNRILSMKVGAFTKPSKIIEFDIYDTSSNLINTYTTTITAFNLDTQISSASGIDLSGVDCSGRNFGECQLDYFFQRVKFQVRPQEQMSTRVFKSPEGLYTVTLPVSLGKHRYISRAGKPKNPRGGTGAGGGTSADNGVLLATDIYVGDDISTAYHITSLVDHSLSFNNNQFVFDTDGKLGIGIVDPSAWLHIKAGDPSTPSIILEPGSLTNTPINGAIEFDGSKLYFTKNNSRQELGAQGPAGPQGPAGLGSNGTVNNLVIINGYLQDPTINGLALFTNNSIAKINGDLLIQANAGLGKILTSDADGKASWQVLNAVGNNGIVNNLTSNNSTLNNSTINNSTINNSYLNTSNFVNGSIDNASITNSNFAAGYIDDSYLQDPTINGLALFTNNSIAKINGDLLIQANAGLGKILTSDADGKASWQVLNAVGNNGIVNNLTSNNSTLNNSTINNSTISNTYLNTSNFVNGSIDNASITNSNFAAGYIDDSYLQDPTINGLALFTNNSIAKINGNLLIQANAGLGKILTSDADGKASWQVLNAVGNNGSVNNLTSNNSTLNNSTINNSTISNTYLNTSNFVNGSIDNASIDNSTINNTYLNTSNFVNGSINKASIDNSTISNTYLNTSNFVNGSIDNASITNSNFAAGYIDDSYLQDPTINGLALFTNNSIAKINGDLLIQANAGLGKILTSDADGKASWQVLNAVGNNGIVNNLTSNNSTLNNSTINNSTISNTYLNTSNFVNGSIDNASITNSNFAAGYIDDSYLQDPTINGLALFTNNSIAKINGDLLIQANAGLGKILTSDADGKASWQVLNAVGNNGIVNNLTTNNSTLNNSTINNSTISNTYLNTSNFVNGSIDNASITNSNFAEGYIDDSYLQDPTINGLALFTNNSIAKINGNLLIQANAGLGKILTSDADGKASWQVLNAVGNNGIVNNLTSNNSTINNSTINNTYLNTSNFVNGSIDNASIDNSTINNTYLNTSNFVNGSINKASIDNSTISNTYLNTSNFVNGSIDNASITNSNFAAGYIDDSYLQDPTINGLALFTNNSIAKINGDLLIQANAGLGKILTSDADGKASWQVLNAVGNNGIVNNLTSNNSTLNNSTINNSTISNTYLNTSNFVNGSIDNASITNSNFAAGYIDDSYLQDPTINGLALFTNNSIAKINGDLLIQANAGLGKILTSDADGKASWQVLNAVGNNGIVNNLTSNNSTLNNSTINNSTISNTYLNTSNFVNGSIDNASITNSNFAAGYIDDSYLQDPTINGLALFTNNSIAKINGNLLIQANAGLGKILTSDADGKASWQVLNAVGNNGIVNNLTSNNSTINNSTINNTYLNTSNFVNGSIDKASITNSNFAAGYIDDSYLQDPTINGLALFTNNSIAKINGNLLIQANAGLGKILTSDADGKASWQVLNAVGNNGIVNNLTSNNSTINNSTINNSYLNTSNFVNGSIDKASITNSNFAAGYIDDSYLQDPTINGLALFTNNSIAKINGDLLIQANAGLGKILTSDADGKASWQVLNAVGNNGIVNNLTSNNSTINNSTINNTYLNTSNFVNGSIDNASIDNSTINNTYLNTSNFVNGSINKASINNSTISNTYLNTSNFVNGSINNASITNSNFAAGYIDDSYLQDPTINGLALFTNNSIAKINGDLLIQANAGLGKILTSDADGKASWQVLNAVGNNGIVNNLTSNNSTINNSTINNTYLNTSNFVNGSIDKASITNSNFAAGYIDDSYLQDPTINGLALFTNNSIAKINGNLLIQANAGLGKILTSDADGKASWQVLNAVGNNGIVNNLTSNNSTINNSTINNSYLNTSNFVNGSIDKASITNSNFAAGYIDDSYLQDPTINGLALFTNNSIAKINGDLLIQANAGLGKILTSDADGKASWQVLNAVGNNGIVNNLTSNNSTINNSTINNTYLNTSNFVNGSIDNASITNSNFAAGYIDDSYLQDPTINGLALFTNNSIAKINGDLLIQANAGLGKILTSDADGKASWQVLNAVGNNGSVNNLTSNNSTINNSTINNSYLNTSNFVNGSIDNASITNSNFAAGYIDDSYLQDPTINGLALFTNNSIAKINGDLLIQANAGLGKILTSDADGKASWQVLNAVGNNGIVNNLTSNNSTINNSTINNSYLNTSNFVNGSIDNASITNSNFAAGYIDDSYLQDPTINGLALFTNNSIAKINGDLLIQANAGLGKILTSDADGKASWQVLNAVGNNGSVNNLTSNNSTINNSTINNSYLNTSNFVNGSIDNASITNSNFAAGYIDDSYLQDPTINGLALFTNNSIAKINGDLLIQANAGLGKILTSDADGKASWQVLNAVGNNGSVNNLTSNNSTINNSTINNSYLNTSNFVNGSIDNASITNSNFAAGYIDDSYLQDPTINGLALFTNNSIAKINGDLLIQANAGLGKILTSDADGKASWQVLNAVGNNGSVNNLTSNNSTINNSTINNSYLNTSNFVNGSIDNASITNSNFAEGYIDDSYLQDPTINGLALFTNNSIAKINGDLLIQANAGLGKILTSDASGKASWQDSPIGEWTDTGTELRPSDSAGAKTVIIGGSNLAGADIVLGEAGDAVFNEQGQNSDFRVEGQADQNLIFADASSNKVGIKTNSPSADLQINGSLAISPALPGSIPIDAASGISTQKAFMKIHGNGASVNITASPQISAGTDGQILVLLGTSDTNTVIIEHGDGVYLNSGNTMVLEAGSTLVLIYDATNALWFELSRSL